MSLKKIAFNSKESVFIEKGQEADFFNFLGKLFISVFSNSDLSMFVCVCVSGGEQGRALLELRGEAAQAIALDPISQP